MFKAIIDFTLDVLEGMLSEPSRTKVKNTNVFHGGGAPTHTNSQTGEASWGEKAGDVKNNSFDN